MLTSSGYFIDGYFLQTSWQHFSNLDASFFYNVKNKKNGHKNPFCLSFKIKAKLERLNHIKGKQTWLLFETWLIATSSTLVCIPLNV